MTELAVVLVDWANLAPRIRVSSDVDTLLSKILEGAERHVEAERPQVTSVEVRLYSGWDHEKANYRNLQLELVQSALGSGAFEGRFGGRLYKQIVARSLLLGGPSLHGTLRFAIAKKCFSCHRSMNEMLCPNCGTAHGLGLEQKMVDTAIVADSVAASTLAQALILFSNDKDLVPGLLTAKALGLQTVVWVRGGELRANSNTLDPAVLRTIDVRADAELWT